MGFRVSGLVRVHNRVRDALRRGIPLEARSEFREWVRDSVTEAEMLMEEACAMPEELPAPSRNAYRFLKELDLENLPEPDADAPAPLATPRISGIVGIAESLLARMWRDRGDHLIETDREFLREDIAGHAAAIEELCEEQGTHPSALSPRPRNLYAWLRFLSDPKNLEDHVRALYERTGGHEDQVVVHLLAMAGVWRRRRRGRHVLARVNEGYLRAPGEVWQALLDMAVGGGDEAAQRKIVRGYAASDDFARVVREIDFFVRRADSARGRRHDLVESFRRVNAAYFGGLLERPALKWSRIPSTRKFGQYVDSSDTVTVSVVLDDPSVPELVIDFIMYHELLHKVLVLEPGGGGRRRVHGPEFRAAEQRFRWYSEARRFLRRLSSSRASS